MSDYPMHLLPLEERIYTFFKDEVLFDAHSVRRKFPDEGEKAIYRALNKLEAQQRIRFAHWANRRKVYTTSGVSGLPVVRMADGAHQPISAFVNHIEKIFDENGHFISVQELDDLVIIWCQLFVIAQDDDEAAKKREFLKAHARLMSMRELLIRLADNIDAIIKHPGLSGDMEVFTKIFMDPKDKAVPTAEELLKFRTKLAKILASRRDPNGKS